MFMLFCTIAVLNFILGYAFAVTLGWAKWPEFKRAKPAVETDSHATAHAATPHAAHH